MPASRYEVLEFLRVHGGVAALKDISKEFGDGVRKKVWFMLRRGDIKRFVYVIEETPVGTIKKKVYIGENSIEDKRRLKEEYPNARISNVYVELSDYAKYILKKFNVKSYYDIPFAKLAEKLLMKRKFKRFD